MQADCTLREFVLNSTEKFASTFIDEEIDLQPNRKLGVADIILCCPGGKINVPT